MSIQEANALSILQNKNIIVNYTADWCLPCKMIEESVFADNKIADLMNDKFINVVADFDDKRDSDWFYKFGVTQLPAIVVVYTTGYEVDRLDGTISIANYFDMINKYINNGTPLVQSANAATSTIPKASAPNPSSTISSATNTESVKQSTESVGDQDITVNPSRPLEDLFRKSDDKTKRSTRKNSAPSNEKNDTNAKDNVIDLGSGGMGKFTVQFGLYDKYKEAHRKHKKLMKRDVYEAVIVEEQTEYGAKQYRLVVMDIVDFESAKDLFASYQKRGVACYIKNY